MYACELFDLSCVPAVDANVSRARRQTALEELISRGKLDRANYGASRERERAVRSAALIPDPRAR